MAQVNAAEEILKGGLFILRESDSFNRLAHVIHVIPLLELKELALLEDKFAEDELVLSEGTSLVAEDIINLAELFSEIESVSLELDCVAQNLINIHHLAVILHDWCEHELRDFQHSQEVERDE